MLDIISQNPSVFPINWQDSNLYHHGFIMNSKYKFTDRTIGGHGYGNVIIWRSSLLMWLSKCTRLMHLHLKCTEVFCGKTLDIKCQMFFCTINSLKTQRYSNLRIWKWNDSKCFTFLLKMKWKKMKQLFRYSSILN